MDEAEDVGSMSMSEVLEGMGICEALSNHLRRQRILYLEELSPFVNLVEQSRHLLLFIFRPDLIFIQSLAF